MAQDWRTPDAEALFNAILALSTRDEAEDRVERARIALKSASASGVRQSWAMTRITSACRAIVVTC